MPIIEQAGNLLTPFGGSAPGITASNPYTTVAQIRSTTVNGNYWIRLSGMSAARQMFIDTENTNGPSGTKWVRIFLPTSFIYNYNNFSEDVDVWLNTDVPTIINAMTYFMYSFVNTSTNVRSQSWYFGKPSGNASAFVNTPPTTHGGEGSPLITQITATRMADGSSTTQFLRTGVSSFNSMCDDSRSSLWGYICLKAGNTSSTGSGGFSDFPSYASYSVANNNSVVTHCANSNQIYNATDCTSSKQFAIYVG
jgi:hypothetical protein